MRAMKYFALPSQKFPITTMSWATADPRSQFPAEFSSFIPIKHTLKTNQNLQDY